MKTTPNQILSKIDNKYTIDFMNQNKLLSELRGWIVEQKAKYGGNQKIEIKNKKYLIIINTYNI